MKKLLLIAALFCATAIVVQAQDTAAPAKKVKKEQTAEQKQLQTDMLAKYDTDKNGKLSKEERAAMSQADKDAWAKAFPRPAKKKMDAPAAGDKKPEAGK